MAGRKRININLDRLNAMYTNPMTQGWEMARAFGCSTRTISALIFEQRKIDPERWPKRQGR